MFNLLPQPSSDIVRVAEVSRMTIDKKIMGDLVATTKGEMLAVSTDIEGSAGYVALERVTGTLAGREGTFVLQHSATLSRGEPQLSIIVVPDSATDQLTGLQGNFSIDIRDGQHFYSFEYTFKDT